MIDFTDIENAQNYAGLFVAFLISEQSQTATVLASATTISELVNKPEVQGFDYIIHKF